MFKFFRKYQKIIILVGLPILLVIFLVPQAIEGIGQISARGGRAVGTYTSLDGAKRSISASQYASAQMQLSVLTRGLEVNLAHGLAGIPVDRADHWFLLVEEARAMNLIGGVDDARAVATQIGMLMTPQDMDPIGADDVIRRLAQAAPGPVVHETLANLRGVQRLVNLYYGGPQAYSTRRLEMVAEQYLQRVDARTVVIGAQSTHEDLPEPTEEELLNHLQTYAEFLPGEGDRGFGYRLPNQVKLEWIEISPLRVRDRLAISDRLSRLEVRQYWMKDKRRFLPAGVTDPESVEFADVESRVRAAMLEELTTESVDRLVRFVEGEVARVTRELPRQGPYFVLPEDWNDRRADLTEIADRVQRQFDLGLPTYERRTERWYDAEEISLLSGLGNATTTRFGLSMRLGDLLDKLIEFGGDPEDKVFVQAGVVGPVLDFNGRKFFYRILETRPSHAPSSLDEVRDLVVRDVKRLADYDRLTAMTDALHRRAATEGLESLAREHRTIARLVQNIVAAPEDSPFSEQIGAEFMPPLGRDSKTSKRIVDHAKDLVAVMLRDGQPLGDFTLEERTVVIEAPHKLCVVVAQIEEIQPVVSDLFRIFMDTSVRLLTGEESEGDDPLAIFSFANTSRRFNYVGSEEIEREEADDEIDTAAE